ncbi:dihydroorotate dehydrogenase [Candidatus Omnitrophota bacterium]
MVNKLSVVLAKLKLANPVMVASGTFGYGREYQDLLPLRKLGAIVTKTITLKAKAGNPPPRIAETDQGLLNSIGLENPGVEAFVAEELPYLAKIGIPVIISVSADSPSEFAALVRRLSKEQAVSAIELNLSCPNLGKKTLVAQDPQATYRTIKAARRTTKLGLIAKLAPNVTDIAEIAKSAADAGCDAVSLVNTFFGLAVDAATKRPKLGKVSGGLSGPAIKPQALWAIRRVYQSVRVPIIGMGGILNATDALEFIICGACAIAVGTANFVNPRVSLEIIAGIKKYLTKHRIKHIKELVGTL